MQIPLSFLTFILIGLNDGAFGILLPAIQTHYNVNKATVALLFLFSTVGYLFAALNSGPLVEKLGSRLFLIIGIAVFFLSILAFSAMPPFPLFLLMSLPLGFGIAIVDSGLNAYFAALPRNAALLNYLHAFYGVGALLGPIIATAVLAMSLAWNSVYFVWAGMSLLLLIGFVLAFKDRQPASVSQGLVKVATKNNSMLAALRIRVVWIVALFLLFYVGAEVSLGSWGYSFLTGERHGSPLVMGWIVSGYWSGLTLGRFTLARVAQRLGEKRLISGCLVGMIAGVLLVWLARDSALSALGLCLTGFSLGPIFPTTIAMMSRIISSRLLLSAIGFLTSMSSVGAALFPWLAGNLAQVFGLASLPPYVIFLTLVMLCLWIALQIRPR